MGTIESFSGINGFNYTLDLFNAGSLLVLVQLQLHLQILHPLILKKSDPLIFIQKSILSVIFFYPIICNYSSDSLGASTKDIRLLGRFVSSQKSDMGW